MTLREEIEKISQKRRNTCANCRNNSGNLSCGKCDNLDADSIINRLSELGYGKMVECPSYPAFPKDYCLGCFNANMACKQFQPIERLK